MNIYYRLRWRFQLQNWQQICSRASKRHLCCCSVDFVDAELPTLPALLFLLLQSWFGRCKTPLFVAAELILSLQNCPPFVVCVQLQAKVVTAKWMFAAVYVDLQLQTCTLQRQLHFWSWYYRRWCRFTCRRILSDRPRIANQHAPTTQYTLIFRPTLWVRKHRINSFLTSKNKLRGLISHFSVN